MAEHNPSASTSNLRFPEWQQHYQSVLTETDREKLKDRVTDTEDAIFNRLQALVGSTDHHAERQAVKRALNALRVLKRERLDFPDWE